LAANVNNESASSNVGSQVVDDVRIRGRSQSEVRYERAAGRHDSADVAPVAFGLAQLSDFCLYAVFIRDPN
jgi:hypothetical protein